MSQVKASYVEQEYKFVQENFEKFVAGSVYKSRLNEGVLTVDRVFFCEELELLLVQLENEYGSTVRYSPMTLHSMFEYVPGKAA